MDLIRNERQVVVNFRDNNGDQIELGEPYGWNRSVIFFVSLNHYCYFYFQDGAITFKGYQHEDIPFGIQGFNNLPSSGASVYPLQGKIRDLWKRRMTHVKCELKIKCHNQSCIDYGKEKTERIEQFPFPSMPMQNNSYTICPVCNTRYLSRYTQFIM